MIPLVLGSLHDHANCVLLACCPRAASRIKSFFKLKADRHISQQLIEDSFNVIKPAVGKKGNTMTNAVYAWSNLVDKRIMSTKYAFREVQRLHALPERNTSFAPETWTPVLRKGKMDKPTRDAQWQRVTGFADTEWFSPGAAGYLSPYADLEAARQAHHGHGHLEMLGNRNYCRLVQKNVILQKIGGGGDDQWYLGVGSADGSIAITWPVKEVSSGQFVPDESKDRKLWAIFDPDAWRARPVKWISPLHRAVIKELAAVGENTSSEKEVKVKEAHNYTVKTMSALATGPARTLWQVAASQAFWNLPLTYLRELAHRRDVELKDTTLLTTLEALYRNAWPDCTHEDVIKMLDVRCLSFESDLTVCDDLVAMEDVCENFDRSFGEQLMNEINDMKATKANYEDFTSELVKFKDTTPQCSQLPNLLGPHLSFAAGAQGAAVARMSNQRRIRYVWIFSRPSRTGLGAGRPLLSAAPPASPPMHNVSRRQVSPISILSLRGVCVRLVGGKSCFPSHPVWLVAGLQSPCLRST